MEENGLLVFYCHTQTVSCVSSGSKDENVAEEHSFVLLF